MKGGGLVNGLREHMVNDAFLELLRCIAGIEYCKSFPPGTDDLPDITTLQSDTAEIFFDKCAEFMGDGMSRQNAINILLAGKDTEQLTSQYATQTSTGIQLAKFVFAHVFMGAIGHWGAAVLSFNPFNKEGWGGAGTVGPIHDLFVQLGGTAASYWNREGNLVLPDVNSLLTEWSRTLSPIGEISDAIRDLSDIYSGKSGSSVGPEVCKLLNEGWPELGQQAVGAAGESPDIEMGGYAPPPVDESPDDLTPS